MSGIDRLQRLLGGAELASLRGRLRLRFEGKEDVVSLQLTGLNAVERAALAQLAGKPPSNAKSITLDIRQVDMALSAAGVTISLRDALERLDGPIVDRAAERELHQRSWAQIATECDHPALKGWLSNSMNAGLLKRLSQSDAGRGSVVLARAAAVLRRLPCEGIPRAQLAAQILGDAHGLDAGRSVATVVLGVLRAERASMGTDDESGDGRDRSLWAGAGVLVNELAKPVLCLNLPFADKLGRGPESGRPVFFSLRDLVRQPPAWQVAGRTVFVCENPTVLALAADVLGARCAPLACTDGMPAAAQRVLLTQLVSAGAQLAYHGDFDWPGISIANNVLKLCGAKPWRMSLQDYELAVEQATERAPLSQGFVDCTWDATLGQSMQRLGVAVAEEAVFDSLATDLSLDAKL